MKSVQELSKAINDMTEEGRLFWAYGLIRETYKVWTIDDNKQLLNPLAIDMLCIARDEIQ